MTKLLVSLGAWLALTGLVAAQQMVGAKARVRDITMILGARENQLWGIGLVAGLAGDGDKDPEYTLQSLANVFQSAGLTVPKAQLTSKNVAVVLVTATIPPYSKNGSKIDVTVAAMGDAKSLNGGLLLQAPLFGGADRRPYAYAQGPLAVGGFAAGAAGGGGGAAVTKNHPTTAQIIGGAIVEREIPVTLVRENSIKLILRESDFTTSARIAAEINKDPEFPNLARAIDGTTIEVKIPEAYQTVPVDFIARIEAIEVQPDVPARIILNERTGTIVASNRIRISSCAVSHGNIVLTVTQTPEVSQPGPFAQAGQAIQTATTQVGAQESRGTGLVALPDMPSVEDVAIALNKLQVSPRDMMAIFQALKQAGALQAELIIR